MSTCFPLTSIIIKPDAMMKLFPSDEAARDVSPKLDMEKFRSRPDVFQEVNNVV